MSRHLTFDGVSTETLGLIYSAFSEDLPEPIASYVSVPGGTPVDVTENLGGVAYGMGRHTLVFLSHSDTEEGRLAKRAALLNLMHGKRADYELSWVAGTYDGRAGLEIDHVSDLDDVVTVTLTHAPYRTISAAQMGITLVVDMTATTPTASKVTASVWLPVPALVASVTAKRARDIELAIGQATASGTSATSTATATLSGVSTTIGQDGSSGYQLSLASSDWTFGGVANGNAVVNVNRFDTASIDDGDVTADTDYWSLSGTNLVAAYTETVTITVSDGRAM